MPSLRLFTSLAIFCCLVVTAAADEVTVEQFSPQGTVKKVRQVMARFSEPMVAFGDPRGGPDPFQIECSEPGSGRWIDSRTWAYDYTRDLPAGVRCAFRVRSGLASLFGTIATAGAEFTFSTGGPAIVSSIPRAGDDSIEEEQAFVLALDAAATESSIETVAWFRVAGIAERVGVRIVTGAARDEIANTVPRSVTSAPFVVLQARQRFPNGAKVELVWGGGVTSLSGIATEVDQVLEFATRSAFTAEFYCERSNVDAACSPFPNMSVSFSAPVMWELARQVSLVAAGGQRWTPSDSSSQPAADRFVDRVEFRGPFPEETTFTVELPADLDDDAARSLLNANEFPLTVKTEPFPPLAKFPSRFGIIESKADMILPVTVRNLEPEIAGKQMEPNTAPAASGITGLIDRIRGTVVRIPPEQVAHILGWLRTVADAKRAVSIFASTSPTPAPVTSFTLPKPNGAKAFEVMGIPLDGPGLFIVELASPRLGASLLGKAEPMYVPTAALVTNLSVHFKWGQENSLAWVTTLDTARPVGGARVAVQDCTGALLWTGVTGDDGVALIDGLPGREAVAVCPRTSRFEQEDETGYYYDDSTQTRALDVLFGGVLVTAQSGSDLSFVHSGWTNGIEPWRFELPTPSDKGPLLAHTIFDRSLFRAGETVHMKHIVRSQTLTGFALVPARARPSRAIIRHEGSEEKFELPLTWDAAGSAESTWPIPKAAKLGTYRVVLRTGDSDEWRDQHVSGSFRVEEFRVPLMKSVIRLPPEPQVAVTEVPVDVSVAYLAGGAAAKLPVVLRALVRGKTFEPGWQYERFVFGNGAVREGIVRRGQGGGEAEGQTAAPAVHQRRELILDANGTARTTITELPAASTLRELVVELEFRDPNGEIQTVTASTPLWPAAWMVGIKPEQWVSSRERLQARVAVLNRNGKPVANAPVQVNVIARKTYSHRKRLVGGFYAYEHVEETGPTLGPLCQGRTDASGLLLCEGAAPAEGNLVLQASTSDEAGRASVAHGEVWVAGADQWWFRAEDSDRIDVLSERPQYEPGDTARLQVRMPFREATALVTVEREGILATSIVRLSGAHPVVEVPIEGRFAPNVFVSVLVVRGRVADVQPTAMVDLGKPAFKLGVTELGVGWRAHQLNVVVSADREVYHVRERATVTVAVRDADGNPPPPGSEIAIAAVDEGLLELRANRSWELLAAMMGRRGYGVQTATAQMQVVGKRHYGLKAVPHGGGGGRQSTRELFDTLLLWQGRVAVDAEGTAAVEVPLNDSLTSFRVVAVATAGSGLFGTGATSIRSTQDLMILPGVAPLVRAGDEFRAEFTLRNATERYMDIDVSAQVEGIRQPLSPQSHSLAPNEATTVGWDMTAPVGVDTLRYDIEARAEDGGVTDSLRVTQQVRPAVPVRAYQAELFRWEHPVTQAVQRPADALPDRGSVQVDLAPTVTTGLQSVRDWMHDYPFGCLEQRVSRAVVLGDDASWESVAAALPAYLDNDGLLKYFPTMTSGSDVLTAYVLAVTNAAGLPLPESVKTKMQDGLRGFVAGSVVRESAAPAAPDLSIRKLGALAALARVGAADAALLSTITIEPNLWPTSAVLDWWSILQRMESAPNRDASVREVEQIVRARLNVQGSTIGFSTEASDSLWWLMVCPDTNPPRLLLHLLDGDQWRDELPQLLRGALARQRRGHWDCTVSNAWGALAVAKFAEMFEATPVAGTSTVTLGEQEERVEWATEPDGAVLGLPWPPEREELSIDHSGTGAPWITIRSMAAIPLTAPLSSGYRISKTIVPLETRAAGKVSRGDVIRVHLEVDAQADMTWVVVNDPIPAGASHLGTGLGRDSAIATANEQTLPDASPTFTERGFEAFRAYYELVPKGTFQVEYTIRLNQSGRFQIPPTRVEALYAPEMFGELPNAPVEVQP